MRPHSKSFGPRDLCFPCACTRREVGGRVYPGICRDGVPSGRTARSVRVRVGAGSTEIEDLVQGGCRQDLERDIGDFIVHRSDGVFAYHLATAFDDTEQEITRVVRGADLLLSTLRQVFVQDLLSRPRPEYAHVPVATNRQGEKLSKHTAAPPTRLRPASVVICDALRFLHHSSPRATRGSAAGRSVVLGDRRVGARAGASNRRVAPLPAATKIDPRRQRTAVVFLQTHLRSIHLIGSERARFGVRTRPILAEVHEVTCSYVLHQVPIGPVESRSSRE